MKILFAIQATGNGHLSRAREIIPHLQAHGQVDLLVSGTQADVSLPYLIRYKKRGISFTFGGKGGIDMIDTVKQFRPFTFLKDALRFPVDEYDLVINDFEPVTAWACAISKKKCIALSHQSAFLSHKTPRPPKRDVFAEGVLKHYAPCTHAMSFHFMEFDSFIHRPVIRAEIRRLEVSNRGHITVYLPAHSDTAIIRQLTQVPDMRWEVFSKKSKGSYRVENVFIRPIENEAFIHSLASSDGLLTAGGFEGPAEAIYLGKKVLSVPMHQQYEQLCNGEAMKKLGVRVVHRMDDDFKPELLHWLATAKPVSINYPDETEKLIGQLMNLHTTDSHMLFATHNAASIAG